MPTLAEIQQKLSDLQEITDTLTGNIMKAIKDENSELREVISKKNPSMAHNFEQTSYSGSPLNERVKAITSSVIRENYSDNGARQLYEDIIALPTNDQQSLRDNDGNHLAQFLLCALVLEYIDGAKLSSVKSGVDNVIALARKTWNQLGGPLDRNDKLAFLVYTLKELSTLATSTENDFFALKAYECCALQLSSTKKLAEKPTEEDKITTVNKWLEVVLRGENTATIFSLFPETLVEAIFNKTCHLSQFSRTEAEAPTSVFAGLNLHAKSAAPCSSKTSDVIEPSLGSKF